MPGVGFVPSLPLRGENSPTEAPTSQENPSTPTADLQPGVNRPCSVEEERGEDCQSEAISKYNCKFWLRRRERKREGETERVREREGRKKPTSRPVPLPGLETCVCEMKGPEQRQRLAF